MDADNLPKPPRAQSSSGVGELVVQNGRQTGARRPLGTPITLVGRGPNCDIRLNVDGVDPQHCVIVQGPEGAHLRDLDSVHGTLVNGARAENVALQHGDSLQIGPFHFRIDLPARPCVTAQPVTEDEIREALRIQAAAVAAQQGALEEEEIRLQQRRADLQQQEEQLAAHLAEKQRQVQLGSEHTQTEREAFRAEKLAHEKRQAAVEKELLAGREAVQQKMEELDRERQRIDAVYRRLCQRWKKHGAAAKEKHQRQARKLEAESIELKERQDLLRVQETSLDEEIVRCNTERELSKRQVQEARDSLARERASWRNRRSLELRALASKSRAAEDARRKLNQARELLVQDKEAWDRQLALLRAELHGLNNRVVHQRRRADQQREEIDGLDLMLRERGHAVAPPDETPTFECDVEIVADAITEPTAAEHDRFGALGQLTNELADQRVHLLEQYLRLAEIQEAWQTERERAAAELESLAQRLLAQEQRLADRRERADQTEAALYERRRDIDALRDAVLVARAQATARERNYALEHERQMETLRDKETLLHAQLAGLAELRLTWNGRRQQEMEALQANQAALAADQKETHDVREALFAKGQRLEQEKRLLTEKTLALELYRQDVLARAKDPAAQRRIDRLRRRWVTLNAALIRDARSEREITQREYAKIDTQRTEALALLSQMGKKDAALNEKQTLLEEREFAVDARQTQTNLELAKLESQRRLAEQKHLHVLDEVDLLATAVYAEPDADAAGKAA